jgi:anti-anti-sigma regulatory factor
MTEQKDEISILLDSDLTIQNVLELRKTLIEHATAGKILLLDLSLVRDVDVAGLQLLCSAHRTVQKLGGVIRPEGAMPEIVCKAVVLTGFDRPSGCRFGQAGSCLWGTGALI